MNRHVVVNGAVVASGTVGEITRGRMYAQALIHEMHPGMDIQEWVAQAAESDERLGEAVATLFGHLHKKVVNGEQWTNLPADAVGGSVRAIAQNVPKIISMALKADIDTTRHSVLLPIGYFARYKSFKDAEAMLKKKCAEAAVAAGDEAKQRRDKV